MSRIERIENTRFLGREFLLWLWYTSEKQDGLISLPRSEEEIELFLDDRLVLEHMYGQGSRHMLSGMEPSTAPEAALALQMNKLPSEAKIKIIQESRAWSFTLRGDDLLPRSHKIPEVHTAHDDDRLSERLYLLEEIERILSELFELFVESRVSEGWEHEQHKIEEWIQEK
jgi:hypothetical protein